MNNLLVQYIYVTSNAWIKLHFAVIYNNRYAPNCLPGYPWLG